jgi:TPP-dependent indolepyruvate ferredoxin oxidoreductase alpha subunit
MGHFPALSYRNTICGLRNATQAGGRTFRLRSIQSAIKYYRKKGIATGGHQLAYVREALGDAEVKAFPRGATPHPFPGEAGRWSFGRPSPMVMVFEELDPVIERELGLPLGKHRLNVHPGQADRRRA